MKKKSPGRELEKVSNLFISSNDEKKTPAKNLFESNGIYPDDAEDEFEVEESVSVRKKIAYPNTGNAQENIKRSLFNHLREDYIICRIELRKTVDIFKPKRKKNREEEVIIFLKGEGNS